MLILSTATSTLAVVTASAGAVIVHATYVDSNGTTITPAGVNTATISTATTTTCVGSPASGYQRNVQSLIVRNTSATVANTTTVQHYDGTNTVAIYSAALQPGEQCQWVFGRGWTTMDANGAEKITTTTVQQTLVPFSSGTTLTLTSNNCYVPVTSTTAGAKSIVLAAATGSGGIVTVTDRGAIAANANNITMSSASTVNGMSVLNIANMSLSFKDAQVGQWDSI